MAYRSDVRLRFEIGKELLDVVRFELAEGVSQSFRLELELSSTDDAIDAADLLDRDAVFTIERDGVAERTVAGIVTAFEQGDSGHRFTRYRAVIESPLARLALRHNSRIFQQVTAPEILATILKEHRLLGAKTTYLGNHEPREYAVQFREHDDQFLYRLATEEGIVYWHQTEGSHGRLVLSDRIDTVSTQTQTRAPIRLVSLGLGHLIRPGAPTRGPRVALPARLRALAPEPGLAQRHRLFPALHHRRLCQHPQLRRMNVSGICRQSSSSTMPWTWSVPTTTSWTTPKFRNSIR